MDKICEVHRKLFQPNKMKHRNGYFSYSVQVRHDVPRTRPTEARVTSALRSIKAERKVMLIILLLE